MGFCWYTGKHDPRRNSTLDLVVAEASCRVVGNLLAYPLGAADLGSRPSQAIVIVEAYRIEEVVDPSSCQVVVASSLVIDIHPSFEVARILVVRIVVVASVDRNQVVGSPFMLVSPSFQVVDRTWAIVAEEDSRVVAFLPSSVEEACLPQVVAFVTCLAVVLIPYLVSPFVDNLLELDWRNPHH